MFFDFRVLAYTLLFFLILEIVAYDDRQIFALAVVLIGVTIWGMKRITKKFIFSVIPIIFSVSATAMLYLIDSPQQKNVFVILSALIYYLGLLGIFRLKIAPSDQTARGMIASSVAASLFFFYSATYGIYLNFSISLWVLMAVYLLATGLVSYEYFGIISHNRKTVRSYSLILGMLMAEVGWMISFWPFGYLTTGVVTLIFYYLFWDLTQSYFLNTLSQKRLIANVVFFSVIVAIILATSRWLPAV